MYYIKYFFITSILGFFLENLIYLILPFFCHEEERQRTGAGMGADHGADVGNEVDGGARLLLNDGFQKLRVLQAVRVGDENGSVALLAGLHQLFRQGHHRGAAAAHLRHGDQVSLVVHVKHGLDAQHIAEECRRGAHSSASLQIHQIVHGEPMCHLGHKILRVCRKFVKGGAFVSLVRRHGNQKSLAARSAKAVHHGDPSFGEFRPRPLCRQAACVVGARKPRGEGDIKNVLSLLQVFGVNIVKHLGVQCGGLRHGAAPHSAIKVSDGQILHGVFPLLALKAEGQICDGNISLFQIVLGQVASSVGQDHVIFHDSSFLRYTLSASCVV